MLAKIFSSRHKDALYVFVGSFIAKFTGFFSSMFIVRLIGDKEKYGYLVAAENIYNYAYLFAALGMANAVFRYNLLTEKIEEKRSYFRYIVINGTLFNLLLSFLAGLYVSFIYKSEGFEKVPALAIILLVALPVQSLSEILLMMLRSLFATRSYAVASCLISASAILGKLFLTSIAGLEGAAASRFIFYSLSVIILFAYMSKKYEACNLHGVLREKRDFNIAKAKRREMLKYSATYMVTNGLWLLFMLNDLEIIKKVTADSALVADYKIAYVLPSNLAILSSSIGIYVAPYFVKHEKEPDWIKVHFPRVYLAAALFLLPPTIICYIFAEPLLSFIFGAEYAEAAGLMRILLIACYINNALRYSSANLLAAMGRIKNNLRTSSIGLALQIILAFFFAGKYKAYAMAVISVITATAMSIISFRGFRKAFILNKAAAPEERRA